MLSATLQKVGEPVTIAVATTGENELLRYKFVWERDGWEDWGVIQDFSGVSECTWSSEQAGDYNIIVDIEDEYGEIVTIRASYKAWDYLGVNVSVVGTNVSFSPNMGCSNPAGFEYKYVWERDNWADWGTFGDFSASTSKSFTVSTSGNYSFYIDVKCPDGTILTKSSGAFYIVTDPYYDRIKNLSSGTGYLIAVSLADRTVSIYSGHQHNWVLKDRFSCTIGAPNSPTITGLYRTTGFKRSPLSTDRRAIYCTQIHGGYFFHSILVSESELGQSLSHGCIRLAYSKALWIYNNVQGGTTVYIW